MTPSLPETEYLFWGCIFRSPELIVQAIGEDVRDSWFTEPACAYCWQALTRLRSSRNPLEIQPLDIVREAIAISSRKGLGLNELGPDFVDRIRAYRPANADTDSNTLAATIRSLGNAAAAREGIKIAEKLSSKLADTSESVADISTAIADFNRLLADSTDYDDVDELDLIQEAKARRLKLQEEYTVKKNFSYVSGIPYPWLPLSKKMDGLRPGLHVVGARPSVGKTSFCIQCIEYWCRMGYRVAFNSLDMGGADVIHRPVASAAMVNLRKLGCLDDQETARMEAAEDEIQSRIEGGLFRIRTTYDIDKFAAWCMVRFMEPRKYDILVIDYAQKMQAKHTKDDRERVTYVTGTLKRLANKYNIPIILLSQLNRDSAPGKERRAPELADLLYSGSLEQDATTVTLLYNDDSVLSAWRDRTIAIPNGFIPKDVTGSYREALLSGGIRPVWVDVKKNQNGETGRYPFVVYDGYFRWFLGDYKYNPARDSQSTGAAKYAPCFSKLTLDWRATEEPMMTASEGDALLFPSQWEHTIAAELGKTGKEIPEVWSARFCTEDMENYYAALHDREKRIAQAQANMEKRKVR